MISRMYPNRKIKRNHYGRRGYECDNIDLLINIPISIIFILSFSLMSFFGILFLFITIKGYFTPIRLKDGVSPMSIKLGYADKYIKETDK